MLRTIRMMCLALSVIVWSGYSGKADDTTETPPISLQELRSAYDIFRFSDMKYDERFEEFISIAIVSAMKLKKLAPTSEQRNEALDLEWRLKLLHVNHMLANKDFDRAAAHLDLFIESYPNFAPAHMYRVVTRERLGNISGAISDWEIVCTSKSFKNFMAGVIRFFRDMAILSETKDQTCSPQTSQIIEDCIRSKTCNIPLRRKTSSQSGD